jgi:hypothetical protein
LHCSVGAKKPTKTVAAKAPAKNKKPVQAAESASDSSSSGSSSGSDSGSDSSSSEDEETKVAFVSKKSTVKTNAAPKEASSSESSSSSDGSGSESESESESEDEKPVAKKAKKAVDDPVPVPVVVVPVVAAAVVATAATTTTTKEKAAEASAEFKIYIKGLPWNASEYEIKDYFVATTKVVLPLMGDGRTRYLHYMLYCILITT